MNENNKYNRRILLTGAAGGLGSALSLQLANADAELVLLDKNRAGLEALSDKIVERGSSEPGLYPMDLVGASAQDFTDLAHILEEQYGGLDVLIHCAAEFTGLFPSEHLPGDDWLRIMQVNLNAPWLLTQTCLPFLKKAGNAQIVWTLDSPGRAEAANWGAYGVSKQAIRTLISQLQAELQITDIAVAGINPGPMNTSLRSQAYFEEKEPVADPGEVAGKIVALLAAGQINGTVDLENTN